MPITLTERAAKHIATALKTRGGGLGLRLGVNASGCSGYAYQVDFADETTDRDEIFEDHGVRVIVDRESLLYLDGTEVDFIREGLNERFDFNNPNVKNACGCGESFNV